MKKEYIPYYGSRAILSASFAILVVGMSWNAIVITIVLFSLFLLYLHSGWFYIDLRYPLTPLRRDARGNLIQRKAMILSLGIGYLVYLFSSQLAAHFGLTLIAGNLLFVIAVLTYFATQFILFVRT
ncbi:MAG: hypothetical protein GY943_26195 [Chloroflexi bacterium]|nr:hypothetical protein [Chloroflexota bacterium]